MKIKKSSELLWLMGIVFVALGVSICSKADLGVSMIAAPAFVVSEAISPIWSGFSVGVTEYMIQGVLLIILCISVRKFDARYLLAFAVAVIYGYVLDFFVFITAPISFDSLWLRYVMLIVGDIITAFGVACFFRTYMPLQVYELFVDEIAKSFKLTISKTKSSFDISLLLISVLLSLTLFDGIRMEDITQIAFKGFHSIGLGTLITTIINTPLIVIMGKFIDKIFEPTPLLIGFEKALKRK
ncbi:MAG: hypothetical protein IKJ91_09395 [Clostridia bacterium]|nr:hypothetical protein [Clostridia bacterium]